MSTPLVRELEAQARALTVRVVNELYRDPFWDARFGARGRKFSEEDGQYHVSYLVQALVAGEAEVLTRYGCWLRSVLTTRGMCTRHLTENFERLAQAVSELSVPAQPAVDYLHAARDALHRELGKAQPLAEANERLSAAICAGLASTGSAPEAGALSAQLPQRIASLLSYLADALAAGHSQQLLAHVLWLDSWLGQQPAGQGLTARLLAAIGRPLVEDASLPEELRASAGEVLREALAAIERARAGESRT